MAKGFRESLEQVLRSNRCMAYIAIYKHIVQKLQESTERDQTTNELFMRYEQSVSRRY